jgi:hypothetical protein
LNPQEILDGTVTIYSDLNVDQQEKLAIEIMEILFASSLLLPVNTYHNSPERDDWLKQADNFCSFILNNFSVETGIYCTIISIYLYKLPYDTHKMPSFDNIGERWLKFVDNDEIFHPIQARALAYSREKKLRYD